MDPSRVSAIKEWPLLANVKQLQSFLGFYHYYDRFTKNYSRIIALLAKLLQKDARYAWGDQQ